MKKIYLAIPYTGMCDSSYKQSIYALHYLINQGLNCFSPIVHSHVLSDLGVRQDWEFWSEIDYDFIDWCDEVCVLIPEEGIQKVLKSTGVNAEIKYAQETGKEVFCLTKKEDHYEFDTFDNCFADFK